MLVDWVHAYSIDPSAVAVTPQPGYTGLSGNRVIQGTTSDDVLRGTTAGDDIYGLAGNDTLIGDAGNNTLTGGAGNDRYYTQNLTDVIAENADEGLDTVYATVNWALSANTENLHFYGAATAGAGNGLANRITGINATQALTLNGGGGDDLIYGSNQSDILIGGDGNDRLGGFGGANQMRGGLGDDIYYSRSAGDVLTEALDAGRDTLYSTVNVGALAANVECLTIYDGATLGVGNKLDNIISGKSSNVAVSLNGAAGNDLIIGSNQSGDILVGGSGNDRLFGMGGDDRFRFLAGSGADQIHGFDSVPAGGQDLIDVSGRGFAAASIGGAIIISTIGADTLVTIGADTIRLFGVDAASVTAGDFVF
jgi:Ca2+-binding RTX toxin-like protein